MSKLSERAMLTALHLGVYSGTLHDQEVTEEVSNNHQADIKDAGRYKKQLISRKFLKHVGAVGGAARRTHRILTLPWDDDGTRILSCTGHATYTDQMRLHRLAFDAAVNEFCKGLPSYVTEAEIRLGSMFNGEEYPSESELKQKFSFDVETKAVPEAGDFRAELSDQTVKSIVKDIERRSEARLEAAMNDVFVRIAEHTGKMVERLRAYKPAVGKGKKEQVAENQFRDSLVYNIKELADLLPLLNITGDQRLVDLQKQLESQLVANSPEILRTNDKVRNDTADKAEKIYNKVKKYLG